MRYVIRKDGEMSTLRVHQTASMKRSLPLPK